VLKFQLNIDHTATYTVLFW